jgi:hypothetical protein
MSAVDRDIMIKGHIKSALVAYIGKNITMELIHLLTDDLFQTVQDAEYLFTKNKDEHVD